VVIYTCITNGYDRLREIARLPKGWRAVCFTDADIKSDSWEIQKIPNLPRIQRHVKICPHHYLKFDRCLWIDGNLQYFGDWNEFDKSGFWVMKHPHRVSLESEIIACIQLGKETEWINALNKRYGRQNVVATGVMIRENTPKMEQFGELWWHEVNNYSHRDQLSFGYAAQKAGITYNEMPFLPNFIKHKHEVGRNK